MIEPPLHEDLTQLTEIDIENKIQDISKKYWTAYRLGKPDLLTQLQDYLTMYKEELQKRYREKANTSLNGDFDQLINVD
jgi:hypothetical protein